MAAIWVCCATAYAFVRAPYDDEWYALTVARAHYDARWVSTLGGDIHPPWVALGDRLLGTSTHAAQLLALERVVASLVAVVVLSLVVSRRYRLSETISPLAAFHPIVFMYGASVRWYPFLFLAQALRVYGIWGIGSRRARYFAVLSGGVLGPLVTYADIAFTGNDAIWFLLRERRRGGYYRALGVVVGVVGLGAALFVLSPLYAQHRTIAFEAFSSLRVRGVVTWFATGLVGESFLPGAFAVVALVAPAGFFVGVRLLFTRARTRMMAYWFATTVTIWAVLALRGTLQPRSRLLVWFLLTASVWAVVRRAKWQDFAARLTLGYLAIALLLTVSQQYSVKGDLDEIPTGLCDAVRGQAEVIAPYPKTAWEIEKSCQPPQKLVSVPWQVHYGLEAGDELSGIRAAVAEAKDVSLVEVPARAGSLKPTNAAVKGAIEERCTQSTVEFFGEDPHYRIKHAFEPSVTPWRFELTRYTCASRNWP